MILRLLFCLGLAIVACKPKIAPNQDTLLPQSQLQPQPQANHINLLKKQIGVMVDSLYTESHDFSALVESYLVSSSGSVKLVSDSVALSQGQKLLLKELDQSMPRPVFEVRNTNNVILLLVEGNIAATALIDEQTKTIINMQFMPGFKTDQLKDNRVKFQQQFAGSTIDFTKDYFALSPWEAEVDPGKVQVDGISGATPVCQAALDMLNEQLPFYRDYFLKNKAADNL